MGYFLAIFLTAAYSFNQTISLKIVIHIIHYMTTFVTATMGVKKLEGTRIPTKPSVREREEIVDAFRRAIYGEAAKQNPDPEKLKRLRAELEKLKEK